MQFVLVFAMLILLPIILFIDSVQFVDNLF